MGGGGGKTATMEQPKLANIQLQTASYGRPIPIVFGTQRVPANVIWHDEFTSKRLETAQEVGKGGGGGGRIVQTEFEYSACVMLTLCEGPVTSLGRVWRDKKVLNSPAAAGFDYTYLGARANATPWPHLTSKHSTKQVPYGGTALMAASRLVLPEAQLQNHTVEVRGLAALYSHAYTDPQGVARTAHDAHPADIISVLLTDKEYGLGWLASRLNVATGQDGTAASSYTNYCHALGFYLSAALIEQRSALDWLRSLLAATNSAAVWSQGVLKIVPYGDTAATGNSFTYTPVTTIQYALGVADFLPQGKGDPIAVERTSLADTYNSIPVEFLDRTQDYKESSLDDPEVADVEAFGRLRRGDPVNAHFVTRASVALALSRILAQRSIWIRNKYKFRLPPRYVLLEPMDLVSLTEPKLGLSAKVVRIIEISEDAEGRLDVVAEEWPFGVATHTAYTPQTGDGVAANFDRDPGNAATPVAFVPNLEMADGSLELWLATSGGADWGGAEVWVSEDNVSYAYAGITLGARHGVTATSMSNVDSTVRVNLAASLGTLTPGTAAAAADDLTAMWIDGEVVSFVGAALVSANVYDLSGVLRGRRSTLAAAHGLGVNVVRLDSGVFKHPIAYARLNKTLWVKLVSFNKFGGGRQDLASVAAHSFAVPAAPSLYPAPTGVTLAISTTEP